jgi:hypothetical protein
MAIVYANVPNTLPLDFSTLQLTDEQLCISNLEQPLELTNEGVLIVMSRYPARIHPRTPKNLELTSISFPP